MKVKGIFTIGLLILLTTGGYFVVQELQKDQSPDDSSAAIGENAKYTEVLNYKLFGPSGDNTSQYAPFLLTHPNLNKKYLFYCKNEPINGVYKDRIYRAEQGYGDSISSQWINHKISLEGGMQINDIDYMSCAMTLAFDHNNILHMYYLGAPAVENSGIYFLHATSSDYGNTWTKKGQLKFEGKNQPIFDKHTFPDSPTVIWKNSEILLFMTGGDGRLYRSTSSDGYNFTLPVSVSNNLSMSHGTVTYYAGSYYLIYSVPTKKGSYDPPTEIYLSRTNNDKSFSSGTKLFEKSSNSNKWDSTYIFTPHLYMDSNKIYVIYAGNTGEYSWWGSNTSIGVREFTENIEVTYCSSFTYSSWSVCTNGKQIREITSSVPAGCTGGNPILTQTCTNTNTDTRRQVGTVNCGPIDVNTDNKLTIIDFEAFVGMLGAICKDTAQKTGCGGKDANGDGKVDSADFESFKSRYQKSSCYI